MSDDMVTIGEHLRSLCDERSNGYMAALSAITDRIDFLEKAIETRFDWLERSTKATADTLDRRLEGMNEFRDTLKDQASRFVTREELGAVQRLNDADLKPLKEFKSRAEGRAGVSNVIALASLILSIIVAAVLFYKSP